MAALKKKHIGTRPFFRGLHTQPFLIKLGLFNNEQYPNCDYAYKKGLYLPSGMTITEKQIDVVIDEIKKFLTGVL